MSPGTATIPRVDADIAIPIAPALAHPPAPLPRSVELPHTPELPVVLQAAAGFAVFGLCAGLGDLDPTTALRAMPATVGIAAGPFLLTTPALLVVHQLAGLEAQPEDLVAAVANALVGAGRLALGLAPSALFFAATSDLGIVVYILAGAAIGALATAQTAAGLVRAERARSTHFGGQALMPLVAAGWAGLTGLIGLRIAVDATIWAFSG